MENEKIDLSKLRLSQNFDEQIGVKKVISTVPIRKPNRQEFVRVHPDPLWKLETSVIEIKEDQETYLIDQSILGEIPGEVTPKVLFTAINRLGDVFLWPIRLPDPTGRFDNWSRSSYEGAELAMKKWIRIASKMSLGAYEIFEASAEMQAPEWPELTFEELLNIAAKDRYISLPNHPVINKLLGRS